MKASKGVYYWFGIFAFCFLAYQQVQDHIRPNYTGGNSTVIYLLGIAPNFFPAIGIPALFLIIFPYLQRDHTWFKEKKHLTANVISLTGLLSWEMIQATSTKLRFDWNDVLWTLIGAVVFQLTWRLTPAAFKEKNRLDGAQKGS